jgi:hypothetical protein
MADAVLCNRCGLSCTVGPEGSPDAGPAGLIGATVVGGYESTPGNGYGALDDGTSYRFSMCEFCLDDLFSTFKIPVTVWGNRGQPEIWRSASRRMAEDTWRHDDTYSCGPKAFHDENVRRRLARG